jgi:hypothetical protein
MVLAAAIRLSEEAGEAHANTIPGEPLWYGIAGFAALLVLLWITTRFNAER